MTAPTTMPINELVEKLGTDDITPEHIGKGLEYVHGRAAALRTKAANEGLTGAENREAKQLAEQWAALAEARDTTAAEVQAAGDALGAIPESLEPAAPAAQGTDTSAGTGTTDSGATGGDTAAGAGDAAPAATDGGAPTDGGSGGAATTAAGAPAPGAVSAASGRRATTTTTPPAATIVAGAGSQKPRESEISKEQLIKDVQYAIGSAGHGKVIVASIQATTDETTKISASRSAEANWSLLNQHVGGKAAITAAGGVVAPFQPYYDVDVVGTADRPVLAALSPFEADRGGLQLRRDIDAFGGTAANAIGEWTLEDDADADNATPKPLWDVPLLDVVVAKVRAVTKGLRLSNISAKYDPEATAAWMRAVDINFARRADLRLVADIYRDTTLTLTEAGTALGTTRDFLILVDKVSAYVRENHRLGQTPYLRTFLPIWFRDRMRADMTKALHTANEDWIALTDEAIDRWFANRRINVTWIYDGRAAISASGTGTTAIPAMPNQAYTRLTGTHTTADVAFPTAVEFPLFIEGTHIALDGGELNLGIIRDKDAVQKNRYYLFEEKFEGVYRKGVESLRVVMQCKERGGSAGTIDPSTLS